MPLLDIIIPTYSVKNITMCNDLILSLMDTMGADDLYHVHIVNNGHPKTYDRWLQNPRVHVYDVGKNLGWEGGLKYGLARSESPYVCFLNDDTYFPPSAFQWAQKLISNFRDKTVGAVGPASNFISGYQNIFLRSAPRLEVAYLIGMCFVTKRSILEEVGGVDDTLPGGDDFDLSIRIQKAGYRLIAEKSVFVYHHGCKTGQEVHGGYWNSEEMIDKTNTALINKHGLRAFWEVMGGKRPSAANPALDGPKEDVEGEAIRKMVSQGKTLELGCGPKKTVPWAIGIDQFANGEEVPFLANQICVADIQANVEEVLPVEKGAFKYVIARHILEHCLDPVKTLKNWHDVLEIGGKLVLALPDHDIRNTIPMNPEHVHAYTKESLRNLLELCGFKEVQIVNPGNNVSFISVYEKVPLEAKDGISDGKGAGPISCGEAV